MLRLLSDAQPESNPNTKTDADQKPTYYVLVPIPHYKIDQCLLEKNDYLEARGCEGKKTKILSAAVYKELTKLGQQLITRLQDKEGRNVHPTIITFADSDILSRLGSNDVLYITAHGNPSVIGSLGSGVTLTPKRLATELKKMKLSRELQTLKLMACNSGIHKKNVSVFGRSSVKPNAQEKSFARKLLIEMQKPSQKEAQDGYTNLDIAGYLGYLTDASHVKNGERRHSYVRFDDETNIHVQTRAKDARLFFLSRNTRKDTVSVKEENRDHVRELKADAKLKI